MEDFQIYTLQVNIGIVVFYLLYRTLFSRDTFLRIRRLFLFSVVFLAFVYPLVSLTSWLEQQPELPSLVVNYAEMMTGVITLTPEVMVEQQSTLTWQQLFLAIWGTGGLILLVRMLVQLGCIGILACKGEKLLWNHKPVIALKRITAPFSFFSWVFVNPAHHDEKELREIIAHEFAHVRQWHSLDMLLAEILCVLLWFNPVVWLLRKEIRQNLEFLADEKVVNSGYNRKNYQYHLLRLSHQSTAVPIVNNFNVIQLKKRIVMMNKKKTSRIGLLKYALLLPVTGLLILAGNAQAVANFASDAMTQTSKTAKVYEGRVVDEQGKPLLNAMVILKGTNTGVSADEKGKFSIEAQEGNTLCFSYVGKATKSVICSNKTDLKDVILNNQVSQLEELVVVGYGKKEADTKTESGDIFVVVEDMPHFKEGNVMKYLAQRVKYPVEAVEKRIQGKVVVSFVIDKTGKVTNPQIVSGVCEAIDREALRVIGGMPDWIPGKQKGVAVDVLYKLPISFQLAPNEPKTEIPSVKVTIQEEQVGDIKVSKISSGGMVAVRMVNGDDIKFDENALVVLDGVAQPASFKISEMKREDIKTLTILKDAVATSIYGDAGKKGVIIITTAKIKE